MVNCPRFLSRIFFLCSLLYTGLLLAQDKDTIEVKTTHVSQNIYMLSGKGGNIGISTGPDGVFVIDDDYAELSEQVINSIKKISPSPIRHLVNTHWHFDHTGGNTAMGKAKVNLIAHHNVRKRLITGAEFKAFNIIVPPAPEEALPKITFNEGITLHWNKDTVKIKHFGPAHTDGDAVIYFESANVIHMGDLYFNGLYPFIDAQSGGSVAGLIATITTLLNQVDHETKIIPGHGPLSNKKELTEYHEMLSTVYKNIKSMKDKGKNLTQIMAAKPSAKFDKKWGNGFLSPDQWIGIMYSTL